MDGRIKVNNVCIVTVWPFIVILIIGFELDPQNYHIVTMSSSADYPTAAPLHNIKMKKSCNSLATRVLYQLVSIWRSDIMSKLTLAARLRVDISLLRSPLLLWPPPDYKVGLFAFLPCRGPRSALVALRSVGKRVGMDPGSSPGTGTR